MLLKRVAISLLVIATVMAESCNQCRPDPSASSRPWAELGSAISRYAANAYARERFRLIDTGIILASN
jgi:hypothetical protein